MEGQLFLEGRVGGRGCCFIGGRVGNRGCCFLGYGWVQELLFYGEQSWGQGLFFEIGLGAGAACLEG